MSSSVFSISLPTWLKDEKDENNHNVKADCLCICTDKSVSVSMTKM